MVINVVSSTILHYDTPRNGNTTNMFSICIDPFLLVTNSNYYRTPLDNNIKIISSNGINAAR